LIGRELVMRMSTSLLSRAPVSFRCEKTISRLISTLWTRVGPSCQEWGEHQACKQSDPELLVVEIDGSRVQNRLKNELGTRWRDDKLVTVSTALLGHPRAQKKEDREPKMLVTTHVATMGEPTTLPATGTLDDGAQPGA
jgi:hypothetical protein